MIANLLVVVISLVAGWIALLPLRRSLAAPLYHLAAFPVGTLLWSFVVALTSVAHIAPGPIPLVVGLTAGIALVAALAWPFRARDPLAGAGLRSYAYMAAGAGAATAAFAAAGITQAGFDSYSHYELSAWYLADTGRISDVVISSRNLLVPALHVGNRILGADWLFLVYPLFATTALALLAWVLWEHSFASIAPLRRAAAIGLVCAAVTFVPIWLFHTWLVHSNMVSAMYMMLAVVALLVSAGILGERHGSLPAASAFVGGLAIAGLTLARPDGLAYAFQGLALLAICHVAGFLGRRAVLATYAGFLLPVLAVYGAAFATLGLWRAGKLQGSWVAALLVAIVLFGAVTLVIGRLRLPAWLTSDATLVRIAMLANLLVVGLLIRERFKQFFEALRNMAGNLLVAGGWGLTWYVLGLAVVLSLAFPLVSTRTRWQRLIGYAVFQFFAIAVVVHGMVHPGRISTKDSFNRVALHIVPVIVWYAASYAGGLIAQGLSTAASRRGALEIVSDTDVPMRRSLDG